MRFFLRTIIFSIILLGPVSLYAWDSNSVLVLNSDSSVSKYKAVEDSFKNAIPNPVVTLDLRKDGESSLKEKKFYLKRFDLIYCIGARAFKAANIFGEDKTIVFSSIINWRRLPRADHIYGVSNELHVAMELTLFKYIFPGLKKIGVLYSPRFNGQWFENAEKEASKAGIDLSGEKVTNPKEASGKLGLIISGLDALWLIPDPVIISGKSRLLELLDQCDRAGVPVLAYDELFAKYGATLIVSIDPQTIGRQSAVLAEELLSGEKPANRVSYPAGSKIVLNIKKAGKYGLKYSHEAIGAVNRVIE